MKRFIFVLLLVLFVIPVFLNAKDLSVLVIDKDIDMPLQGVTIQIPQFNITAETDSQGKASFNLPENLERVVVIASLIGYEQKKVNVKKFNTLFKIYLTLEGIVESEEMVIETESVGKTDEKVGVSTVMEKEEITATAEIGIFEDVMSTIKLMPGVVPLGNFARGVSVRGGSPEESSTVMDGFLVRYPYQWGGAVSIFDPNITKSIKFYNGIIPAKYGPAISGLTEVTTVKPDTGFRLNTIAALTMSEVFVQTPFFMKNSGFLIGGKIFYPEFMAKFMNNLNPEFQSDTQTAPYIRNAQAKWFWEPNDRIDWYINGFFGSDGVGVSFKPNNINEKKKSEIVYSGIFDYYQFYTFVNTGMKILPVDWLLIHFLAGYEFLNVGTAFNGFYEGTQKYSTKFKNYFNAFPLPDLTSDRFSVDIKSEDFTHNEYQHDLQGRIDLDFTLHEKVILSSGTGIYWDAYNFTADGKVYQIVKKDDDPRPKYKRSIFEVDAKDYFSFETFYYISLKLDLFPKVFDIELGTRLDHYYIYNDEIRLNTIPAINPRISLTYTPVRNLPFLEYFSVSIGSGLYSNIPDGAKTLDKDLDLKDFEVKPPKNVTNVLGFEFGLPLDFKFKIEGYYKYYFDRFNREAFATGRNNVAFDGTGHATGFDILFQRKISRYIDGWITYSFVYARNYLPINSREKKFGVEKGFWYYPNYHRFHNLSLVLNVKPMRWMTINHIFKFTSGSPRQKFDSKEMFFAEYNNEIIEMYTANYTYDENLRTNPTIGLDLKISFHTYFPRSKVRFATYIACEDILSPLTELILPNEFTSVNQFTGEESINNNPQYGIGFPLPSFGIKVNF